MQQSYLVIGNHSAHYDEGLDIRFNIASGLSAAAFQVLLKDFSKRMDLKLLYLDDDTAIMTGDLENKRRFIEENGSRFSISSVDEGNVLEVIDAIYDSEIIMNICNTFSVPRPPMKTEAPAHLDA